MRGFVVPVSIVSLAVGLTIGGVVPVAAQDATPGAGADRFPITPDPADCTGEQRDADELLALWYAPDVSQMAATPPAADATSVTIPLGPPADEATAAAVADSVRQVFACFAAGDALRAYAFFTDDLALQFGPEPGTPREEAEAFLAAPMEELEEAGEEPVGGEAEAGQIVAVTDVMELADGRVGAIAVERSEGRLDSVFLVLERDGDRLLADELIDFAPFGDAEGEDEGGEATPAP
jgi:hypothetical protein